MKPPRIAVHRTARALFLASVGACPASAMLVPAAAPAHPAGMQKKLESKLLRERLHELGLSDKEIQMRLGKLSEQQIHQLAVKA